MRIVDSGVLVNVNGRVGGGRQGPMAGDVVSVVVGLENVLNPHTEVARQTQVLVDLKLGVDDSGDAGVLVTDQITRAPQVIMSDLAKDHVACPERSPTSRSVRSIDRSAFSQASIPARSSAWRTSTSVSLPSGSAAAAALGD